MIESVYWKKELLIQARRIAAQQRCRRWSEKRVVLLERDIMIACFCIRSLIERDKVTPAVAGMSLPVVAYPIRPGKRVTRLNFGDLEDLYDLESPVKRSVGLGFLTNQVIHSYTMFVIRPENNRQRFEQILVCSDFERNRQLFDVEIDRLLLALRKVASSYPTNAQLRFDEKIQDYRVVAS